MSNAAEIYAVAYYLVNYYCPCVRPFDCKANKIGKWEMINLTLLLGKLMWLLMSVKTWKDFLCKLFHGQELESKVQLNLFTVCACFFCKEIYYCVNVSSLLFFHIFSIINHTSNDVKSFLFSTNNFINNFSLYFLLYYVS